MIRVNLDIVMAMRRMSSGTLAQRSDLTNAHLSIVTIDRAHAIRFSTLDALCRELGCQPGDILEYVPDEKEGE